MMFLSIFFLFTICFLECGGSSSSAVTSRRIKLKHRKNQELGREEYLEEVSVFRKMIEKPLREPSFVPYPIQSSKDAFNYSALHSLSNLYLQSFLNVLAPPSDVDTIIYHVESPQLVAYFPMFERNARLWGFRRMAESRCLLHVRSRTRQQKCLFNVISLYGPMYVKHGQSLPWIVLRGLLIREGIYPDDGFKDLRSTCRSILTGFNKMRSMEIRASAIKRDIVVYDEAASFMLTFQEAINCFLRQALMSKNKAEVAFYRSVWVQFRANDLYEHLLDGERELTWQKCFPWVASALEPKTTPHKEIQTVYFIHTVVFFAVIVFFGLLYKAFF